MKYCIIVTSDTGKTVKIVGNEYIEVQAIVGNKRIALYELSEPADNHGWLFKSKTLPTSRDEIERQGLHGY